MAKSKTIVYGGSGFLGSHVADALSEAGHVVRIFDCRRSPYLRDDQEMIIGDLMDIDAVAAAAKDCRYVYNFAALADIDDAKDRPIDAAKVNILGNVHTLEAARLADAERFVFASSIYVYSKSGSFYRATKQACEVFVETYHEQYGLNYTVLRYGSLYGRRADKRNCIYDLIRQALEKRSIKYDGSGEAVREYIHVKDAARLSVEILGKSYENRHLILTGHEKMTVKSVLQMISEMVPGEVTFAFENKHIDGHYVMTPYVFNPKLGHKLVLNDFVDLGQGLLDCIDEVHEHLEQEKSEKAEENRSTQ